MKGQRESVDQLLRLYDQWTVLKKIITSLRQRPTYKSQIDSFTKELDSLCDVSVVDAYNQLRSSRGKNWNEDWLFLLNQRESRTGYMSNVDQTLVRSEEKRKSKRVREEKRAKESHCSLIMQEEPVSLEDSCGSDESNNKAHDEEDFRLKPSAKKKRPRTVELHVPAKLIKNSSEGPITNT